MAAFCVTWQGRKFSLSVGGPCWLAPLTSIVWICCAYTMCCCAYTMCRCVLVVVQQQAKRWQVEPHPCRQHYEIDTTHVPHICVYLCVMMTVVCVAACWLCAGMCCQQSCCRLRLVGVQSRGVLCGARAVETHHNPSPTHHTTTAHMFLFTRIILPPPCITHHPRLSAETLCALCAALGLWLGECTRQLADSLCCHNVCGAFAEMSVSCT